MDDNRRSPGSSEVSPASGDAQHGLRSSVESAATGLDCGDDWSEREQFSSPEMGNEADHGQDVQVCCIGKGHLHPASNWLLCVVCGTQQDSLSSACV